MINSSGIGTYLKNVLPGIINAEIYNITCLGNEEELRQFTWFGKVRFISFNTPVLSGAEQLKLARVIPPCDIYWCPNWNIPLLPVKAKKIVITVHDVYHLANRQHVPRVKYHIISLLLKNAIKKADRVITVSNFSKQEILTYTGCNPAKITVTHLAVDDNLASGVNKKNDKQKYLLYVGNVKPSKNIKNALLAFSQLKRSDSYFYIVGKKEGFVSGYNNLEEIIKPLGNKVVFTGHVTDSELKNYYANAAAFILPSKYEGFGLPLLEAMKFNLPVACSNAASLPEIGGTAVEYFNPENVEEMTAVLAKILNPAYRINTQLYAEQLQKFSWNKTIADHLNLLSTLV